MRSRQGRLPEQEEQNEYLIGYPMIGPGSAPGGRKWLSDHKYGQDRREYCKAKTAEGTVGKGSAGDLRLCHALGDLQVAAWKGIF